ncbi:GMC family oxidoreductase N-terminal domain-containing protein [Mesorhizobium sp.]|uniref:GMC family oxidoreductase n=1 Tax=Mesorhizobium sp. TaxID=1871066 RepID=UPI0025806DBD|nr:GMC family oxidoreductase N-terminal domain-containing protein [Mesorhizobium sp.]
MKEAYDIIVAGAGSAGCVLANLLSENAGTRVLLLEAGGHDWNPLVSIPLGARKLLDWGWYHWDDWSEPDLTLNGRRQRVPHGKIVGGTSSINFMAHVRGHPADYADWVRRGAESWSYEALLPFFRQCERWLPGADAWRGGNGSISAEPSALRDPIAQSWFAAIDGLGLPRTADYNGEHPEGFGPMQYSVGHGRRSSAASAYLKPALSRRNLRLLTRATVTRVLFDGRRAIGVEYLRAGRTRRAFCSDRLVLSMGAINTPHVLMLSGIGPADHLRQFGINPVLDLPVGKSLEDHLGFFVEWERRDLDPFHASLRLDRIAINMIRAYLRRTGPAAHLPGSIGGFLRTRPDLTAPDLQFLIPFISPSANVWLPGQNVRSLGEFAVKVQLTSQRSRGEVKLASADLRKRPVIAYNSLSDAHDLEVLRRGFRIAQALGNSPALAAYRKGPKNPDRVLEQDGEIDSFIRATAIQQYHPAGTCAMGSGNQAVLTNELKVRGSANLFVVDASAMPRLISGNPNIVVSMMAARAVDLWRRPTL